MAGVGLSDNEPTRTIARCDAEDDGNGKGDIDADDDGNAEIVRDSELMSIKGGGEGTDVW